MIPWVPVFMLVGWISAVRPTPAMLVPFPLFGLPWLAMTITVAMLPTLPDDEDEFGDRLDHSGSHVWWLLGTIWLG